MVGISARYPPNGVPERRLSLFVMTVVHVHASPEFAVQALYRSHLGWLNTWLRVRLGNAAECE
jgi:RNA polymerase sigma-70 factor (ECF subfamily)